MSSDPPQPAFLRPILPRTELLPRRPPMRNLPPRRPVAQVACKSCRRARIKCNGARPSCSACDRKNQECIYRAETGESSNAALRRRHREDKEELRVLRSSHNALRRVVTALQTFKEDEAAAILRRLRESQDPMAVATQLEGGALLLQLRVAPRQSFASVYPPAAICRERQPLPRLSALRESEKDASQQPPDLDRPIRSVGLGSRGLVVDTYVRLLSDFTEDIENSVPTPKAPPILAVLYSCYSWWRRLRNILPPQLQTYSRQLYAFKMAGKLLLRCFYAARVLQTVLIATVFGFFAAVSFTWIWWFARRRCIWIVYRLVIPFVLISLIALISTSIPAMDDAHWSRSVLIATAIFSLRRQRSTRCRGFLTGGTGGGAFMPPATAATTTATLVARTLEAWSGHQHLTRFQVSVDSHPDRYILFVKEETEIASGTI
ncbi:nitrate assimilation regulatory protein nirA [Beauveria bassiana ARSEF 2860]|uniref:Nitrate assimilation regulatory protein nirA n=1 Tax=Beauveria bassiana (strain ARSEF 2860) TaxID=655819 RepID=J5J489_BEAB2|nr:nitrate assimilation regulatory protein nirA [Beauveria bassiana ARSEF 2860]EJP61513.1 nitrate assimilation regulatory protein nirA [Beauveria bassiana ARSEF 2860]